MNRLWARLRHWLRLDGRHVTTSPEPVSEPEQQPEGISPAQLTQMDLPPSPGRVPPYVDPDAPERHRHRRPR